MKRTLNILLLLYTLGLSISSQTVEKGPRNIAPSPQAYAFAQYAEMPVSLFTGTPSINIPLFTINCGAYAYPISLSYHASGIKVAQDASWVGLGWNLNAGGCISRSVRGRDDMMNGYYEQDEIIPPTFDFDINDDLLIDGIPDVNPAKLRVDGEPDVFYYNFLGYSGKFYCKNRGIRETAGNGFYLVNPDDTLR